MAIEIEKKYRLTAEQREAVLSALKDVGAEFEGEDREENTIFGGGTLNEDGAVVRIRRTEKRAILTYKKRIVGESTAKHQIEYESEVSDPAEIEAILRCLGLAPKMVYEKHRMTWKFRAVEIVLDELPFGLFMEIEGPVTSIAEAEMLLGLDDLEVEHETYPRLTARYGVRSGDLIEARFATTEP